MAAGQDLDLQWIAALPNLVDQGERQIDRERQVVLRVDHQRLLVMQPLEKRPWTDRAPEVAQLIDVDVASEALTHVLGRETAPHDIAEIGRASCRERGRPA